MIISIFISAQKIELIKLDQSIKDRKSLTRSLTLIDNRTDKNIGILSAKKGTIEVKLSNEDLKTFVENWFESDNKIKGNNDIVLLLEELKVYDEQTQNDKQMYAKARIKISSFIQRNDKYYFIDRFNTVIVCDQRRTASSAKYLSQAISDAISEFIKASYSNPVQRKYIPDNELNHYDSYLIKNNKSLSEELKDGVYLNFKNFSNQLPATDYHFEKNKKGNVVRIKNKEDLAVSLDQIFCYVDSGKAYRVTPVGFLEMKKNENGFYILSSRAQLFTQTKTGGAMIGAMAGGIVGAAIGAAIDSGSNKTAINGLGFKSATISNVYIDSLTGDFTFQQ